MNEFELIARHFQRPAPSALLGVGDDAAIVRPTPGCDLHMSVDMLVEGRHFFADVAPRALGHKTLAVNLSDMAAMGARARWALLSIALPKADEAWVAEFAAGFHALALEHGVELIGGDTTCGPLTLSVTVLGEAPSGQALRRDAARPGDDVWVSGELGLGALAVRQRLGWLTVDDADLLQTARQRLEYPQPRLALGRLLLPVAHAAADVSDGLMADLGHILAASGVAAEIQADALPSDPRLEALRARYLDCLAAGGDDYELVFTAPPQRRAQVEAAGAQCACRVSRIGRIVEGGGGKLLDAAGHPIPLQKEGYDHFG
ncbi:thiamine-phosphate kinase [Chromobacterium subtsugae]|uniref:Thiamine-monophosphate kinase n=1 Tax=Chromobacterium subtsugae TaxID=251747 RepID=A0ABS7FEW1_9NEIS|nr:MULTISPECIES: thiamine-phosphate kinase [Chromobacterium]KUM05232.1 thiamine monophosphate kinase [Chromobacterium subtsugae]KZE87689.1 thiamine monophosphate kinase [Chromobacterium sp. F49]MBW7568306.1 thiamine-phosphate kinase [Chromobacterium subtsugae]MBW8288506.1 thiamine-phosphate kinase [Chromobacterium subtsugae]WSE89884.1 thiamine-phosphate kinase [Chromobacterium subtsugae]